MRPTGIVANLPISDPVRAREFYGDYLGLSRDGFDLGWVVQLQSADGRAIVQLVTRDASAPVDSVISVHVGEDVEAAYAEAQRRGYEIVHPPGPGGLGSAQVLRPRPGRQRRQRREPLR